MVQTLKKIWKVIKWIMLWVPVLALIISIVNHHVSSADLDTQVAIYPVINPQGNILKPYLDLKLNREVAEDIKEPKKYNEQYIQTLFSDITHYYNYYAIIKITNNSPSTIKNPKLTGLPCDSDLNSINIINSSDSSYIKPRCMSNSTFTIKLNNIEMGETLKLKIFSKNFMYDGLANSLQDFNKIELLSDNYKQTQLKINYPIISDTSFFTLLKETFGITSSIFVIILLILKTIPKFSRYIISFDEYFYSIYGLWFIVFWLKLLSIWPH